MINKPKVLRNLRLITQNFAETLVIFFFFIQCSNHSKPVKINSIPEAAISQQDALYIRDDTASFTPGGYLKPPQIISLDTCPKAHVFRIPKTGISTMVIQTKSGPKTIKLEPPQTHPAGFFSYMQNYNTEQGLALSSISFGHKSAICDKLGNLWFGTPGGGVSRFDGKSFTNFTMAQGLANDNVWSILEDREGNLWFGTNGGVSRYNGKFFTNFTIAQGLANNTVLSILEDKRGNLWFGTYGGGVSCFDPSVRHGTGGISFFNFTEADGLANNIVWCITEDKLGNLWFGTKGGGISCYDPSAAPAKNGKLFTSFTSIQGLANNTVWCITEDKVGKLWLGTDGGGINNFDPYATLSSGKNCFTRFTMNQGLANNTVWCITEDKEGKLWFGTEGGGVSSYDGNSFTNYTIAQGLANNTVYSITADKTGFLWIGTSGGGISRYDGNSFTNFTKAQGLPSYNVRCIAEDKMHNLWFGTQEGGISCYDGKFFTNFTMAQGLSGSTVRCITEDRMGNLWFGTDEGISIYDAKSFTHYTTSQGLANNTVLSITEDKAGNLWISTDGGGVSCFDGKSFTNYTTNQGLPDNNVRCITEDKSGNLWFGTLGGGVSRYEGNHLGNKSDLKSQVSLFTNFTTDQGLANNTVISIREDKMGNLWFGTDGGGLSRYDGKSFLNYTTSQGLANNNVMAIIQDQKGIIWAGTNLGLSGLSFEVPNLQTNTRLQKLSENSQSFKTTKLNYESSQTGKGHNENELVPAGLLLVSNEDLKTFKPVWEIYNNNTGYPVKDVNGSSSNGALLCDSKGIIWTGTGDDKTALVRFDHDAVLKNKQPPSVMLQSIKVNYENLSWYNLQAEASASAIKITNDSLAIINEEFLTFGKELTDTERFVMRYKFAGIKFDSISRFYPIPKNLVLPYSYNNIIFEFNAVIPARHSLVRYQYILDGYDKNWCPVTDKSSASFGNIYEGVYTFRVKACSPDGIWSEPVAYSFKVLPPWYRVWWMYCIYSILIISVLYLLYRWRVAKLVKEKEILEGKVKLRTAELEQANEEITAQRDNIEEQRDEIEAQRDLVIEQKEEIVAQRDLVTSQKERIEKIHKEVSDSINYARRIQSSSLPNPELLRDYFSDVFILFKPKDVVSGDFYWFALVENHLVVTVADCTGHGVPGAFMSMLGMSLLKEIVVKEYITQPNIILRRLRKEIIKAMGQTGASGEQKDGMDISLCSINMDNYLMQWSGANNPCLIVKDGELTELKADKMPIAIYEKMDKFTLHEIQLQKNDIIYFSGDGYHDQFGGPNNKKFMSKRFKELLLTNSGKPMEEQLQILDQTIEDWMNGYGIKYPQTDDITVMGIKI